MERKTKKIIGASVLIGLICIGAFVWLSNRNVVPGLNKIKTGTTSIKFENKEKFVTLENVLPRPLEYAAKNNPIYTFEIKNADSVDLDYYIKIREDKFVNEYSPGELNIVIKEINANATDEEIRKIIAENYGCDINSGLDNSLALHLDLAPEESQRYALMLYTSENTRIGWTKKTAKFGLSVEAIRSDTKVVQTMYGAWSEIGVCRGSGGTASKWLDRDEIAWRVYAPEEYKITSGETDITNLTTRDSETGLLTWNKDPYNYMSECYSPDATVLNLISTTGDFQVLIADRYGKFKELESLKYNQSYKGNLSLLDIVEAEVVFTKDGTCYLNQNDTNKEKLEYKYITTPTNVIIKNVSLGNETIDIPLTFSGNKLVNYNSGIELTLS